MQQASRLMILVPVLGFLAAPLVQAQDAIDTKMFQTVPSGLDRFILESGYQKAIEVFQEQPGGSIAFAQSPDGSWGYSSAAETESQAQASALGWCRKYNEKFESEYPCEVIYTNGEWVASQNEALAIIQQLPEWTPREPIDVSAIHDSAREDRERGDYPLALTKRLWLHQHGASVQRAMFGVRASFWLAEWKKLADAYPPAKVLMHYAAVNLKQTILDSTHTEQDVRKNGTRFIELHALDRSLGFFVRSLDVMYTLEERFPGQLKLYVTVLRDELIAQKQYELLNQYLSPKTDYLDALRGYLTLVEHDATTAERRQNYLRKFVTDMAVMVAILSNNNRQAEAEDIVARVEFDVTEEQHRAVLQDALRGVFPPSK